MKTEHKKSFSEASPEMAEPCRRFFTALNRESVIWCHWKSSEHLEAGLTGDTDLDLLFRPEDRRRVFDMLQRAGFIIFKTPAHLAYPGVIDAFALDEQSGKILHAHCHFLLTLGEPYVKSYILPWHNEILSQRRPSENFSDIYIPSPAHEALLLIVRYALKQRWRDRLRGREDLPKDFTRELAWLLKRTDQKEIAAEAKALLSEDTASAIAGLNLNNIVRNDLYELGDALASLTKTRDWRRMRKAESLVTAWRGEGIYYIGRIASKLGLTPVTPRRLLPRHGLIVAVVGPDGSGKSTLTQKIVAEWSNKISIRRAYFGTGDGAADLGFRALKIAIRVYLKLRNNLRDAKQSSGSANNDSPARDRWFSIMPWAVVSALSKRKWLRKAANWRRKGFVVICDRFPHHEALNDGPLLGAYINDERAFRRKLARWEQSVFQGMCASVRPDLVIRVIPSLDAAVARKEENASLVKQIGAKIELLRNLSFGAECKDLLIEGDATLGENYAALRGAIWQEMRNLPQHRILLTEALGLAGVGKTTVINHILADRQDLASRHDAFTDENAKKAARLVRSLIFGFPLYLRILFLIVQLGAWRNLFSINHLLRMPVQADTMREFSGGQAVLADQFLLQNLWSVLYWSNAEVDVADLAPLIAKLYRNTETSVLFFAASPDDIVTRVSQRSGGESLYDNLSEAEIRKQLATASPLMDRVVTAAVYAGLNVEIVDTRPPAEVIAEAINLPF